VNHGFSPRIGHGLLTAPFGATSVAASASGNQRWDPFEASTLAEDIRPRTGRPKRDAGILEAFTGSNQMGLESHTQQVNTGRGNRGP